MKIITFNQWKKGNLPRRFRIAISIGRIDLLAFGWWRGGRIGVTVLGFGFALIPKN